MNLALKMCCYVGVLSGLPTTGKWLPAHWATVSGGLQGESLNRPSPNVKDANIMNTVKAKMNVIYSRFHRGQGPDSPGTRASHSHTPSSLQPSNLSVATRVLAWIKGIEWTWHCTPTGRHPSSITLSYGITISTCIFTYLYWGMMQFGTKTASVGFWLTVQSHST
jgi:hypothetical protein